ncbi:hypothetical protein SAMN02745124_00359 [Desulfofustis glycolicus DSM 9705]|uniref:Uncharacterized protein n=1 Tax=Desulfofustis glycolicus DSM 9705 TaxID=1121409 RepID=A0A1M5SHH5_9BACT|nr:hypothetical protein SAMN02745124_00359 [Desulfofustis glycolicus DSM 9705]
MVATFEIEVETGSPLTNNGRATGDEKNAVSGLKLTVFLSYTYVR